MAPVGCPGSKLFVEKLMTEEAKHAAIRIIKTCIVLIKNFFSQNNIEVLLLIFVVSNIFKITFICILFANFFFFFKFYGWINNYSKYKITNKKMIQIICLKLYV